VSAKPLYDPAPIQQEFHLCTADEALLGGAAGPGKSLCLLLDPIITQAIGEHERFKRGEITESAGWALHLRREFTMLDESLNRAHSIFPRVDPGVHWDGDRKTFTFSSGYKYQFGHLKDIKDWRIYDSRQFTHIGFDELIQFEEEQYRYLCTRVRTTDPVLMRLLRVRAATNPGPGWVRDYFVDPAPNGRVLLQKHISLDDGTERTRSRVFIPATLKDNPDEEYRRQYEANLKNQPAHIRQARLYGNWYIVAGAFFANEFDPSIHVVKPFNLPDGWTRFRSMDWGYKSPGVVLWWAVDKDENLICYRELKFQGLHDNELAEEIRGIEMAAGEWNKARNCSNLSGPADTQIWEQRGNSGPTISECMSEKGVWWEKATKAKLASVQQLIARLKDRTGEKGVPAIRFFDTCKYTIRTLPSIGTDEKNPELYKDGGDDHALDAVRYGCMYRLIRPKSDWLPNKEPRDELEDRRRKTIRRNPKGGSGHGYG
jgi:hypothetical protein